MVEYETLGLSRSNNLFTTAIEACECWALVNERGTIGSRTYRKTYKKTSH